LPSAKVVKGIKKEKVKEDVLVVSRNYVTGKNNRKKKEKKGRFCRG
jgi:hypothetical protein